MPRYKAIIEYNGSGFHGSAKQSDRFITVEKVVATAITHFFSHVTNLCFAGRTDAGVHAKGQVMHFDLEQELAPRKIISALNYYFKTANLQIAILNVMQTTPDFHARFSAIERRYIYRIITRPAPLVLDGGFAWHVPQELNVKKMRLAARHLLGGCYDFTSFRDSNCQAINPMKTLNHLIIAEDGELITINVAARSFLHHMVRNIVGTLKLVGAGKILPDDMRQILIACDRRLAGPTAPACGLCLIEVIYTKFPIIPITPSSCHDIQQQQLHH